MNRCPICHDSGTRCDDCRPRQRSMASRAVVIVLCVLLAGILLQWHWDAQCPAGTHWNGDDWLCQ